MSTKLSYRILNVFTVGDDPFSGNPLCVFEDAQGLSTEQMQNLARQLNLSETTFVTPPAGGAMVTVRIFTPDFEMPFAGHPTLGTAHVVRALFTAGDALVLRMPAGDIPVRADGNTWTLQANHPTTRAPAISAENVTKTVGLPPGSLAAQPLWVNTGVEQLVVPLRSADDVRAAQADPRLLREFGTGVDAESQMYVWAPTGPETIESRFFFIQGKAAIEDPATGSACANLGGWFLSNGERGIHRRIHQGGAIQRPSILDLTVDDQGTIFVTGTVREVGRGTFTI
ncbi:MAG: PhzF family phenazine biosynthesis protein [Actinomycetota bacterium]